MNTSNSTNPFRRGPSKPPITPDTNPFRRSNTANASALPPIQLPTRSQTTGSNDSSSTNPFRRGAAGPAAAPPAASASRPSPAGGTKRKEHWSDKDPVALLDHLYENFAHDLKIEGIFTSKMKTTRIAKQDFSKTPRYQGLLRLVKGFYDVEHGTYRKGEEARACSKSFCLWLTRVSTRCNVLLPFWPHAHAGYPVLTDFRPRTRPPKL